MLAPLCKFVSRGLAKQRDELVDLGLYEKDDPNNFLFDPDTIAERMIRGLMLSDFDMVSYF
jgi:hypothetical protein